MPQKHIVTHFNSGSTITNVSDELDVSFVLYTYVQVVKSPSSISKLRRAHTSYTFI